MKHHNYNGALQKPLNTGFNETSTSKDIIKGVDLKGKIAIVTGGNTGVGLETVKTLSGAGATVIVPARNVEKARKNLQGIARVEIEELDLMIPESIDNFTTRFLSSGRPLDLLINNAGIMFVPLRRDQRGIESQLATNYLAVFHLTAKLWSALKRAQVARVINISSQGHQFAPFDFKDPNFKERDYETLLAYGQSKTAVNLFTLELDRRAKPYGVHAYSIHPGNIWGTELTREASLETLQQIGFYDANGKVVNEVVDSLKTIQQGASTTIWGATSPLLDTIGGVYLEDNDIAEIASGEGLTNGVKGYSLQEDSAKKLWDLTENLIEFKFKVD